MSDIIQSKRAPTPVGAYPHARRVGNLLYLSGVGPRQAGSTSIPGVDMGKDGRILSYDIAVQTRSVFSNVKAILEDAGLGMEHLVDITVFLTDMAADFKTFNSVYASYFTDADHVPCRTTVEVGALPTPIAVEFKCIAHIPE